MTSKSTTIKQSQIGMSSEDNSLSTTPTPSSHLHRTMSHGSQWSAAETPQHHNQGTSYFSSPGRPAPILIRSSSAHSFRRGPRSTSLSSTTREDALSEADEEDRPRKPRSAVNDDGDDDDNGESDEPVGSDREDDDPITLKDRQSLINVEHPFGLPIWKPALYKKSRSVTRNADAALHSVPSAQAERTLLPGNLFWAIVFGWWLALACFAVSALLYVVPQGGKRYSTLIFGLGWYIAWPFGKYVEGDEEDDAEDTENLHIRNDSSGSAHTVRAEEEEAIATIRRVPLAEHDTITPQHVQSVSWNSNPSETTPLRPKPTKSYGAASPSSSTIGIIKASSSSSQLLGKICFWLAFVSVIAPLMLLVCTICWALVVTIPMAKLNWQLLKHIFNRPTTIRFCSAPQVLTVQQDAEQTLAAPAGEQPQTIKAHRISEGQAAPSGTPSSKVLLCTYRAVGLQYYKYTVGGVNIMFVNLMPLVFFVIFDGVVLLKIVEDYEHKGKHVPALLGFIASKALIFFFSLLSVIPLSYFIGMAVASISAQSSIGMGAVINATFGSIIEILLYSIALTQGKGHLVEGSIVGSLIAGVLLMPGMSMVSSALRRKEQKFNAKSAGVTSMMLIMAIIGALTPTLFYQTYGNFQLICSGCPSSPGPGSSSDKPWICEHCYYEHPDPVEDPFYQSTVKNLMYFCAIILVFSYLIGLWFSLRTHASQIWQNPQQLLHSAELPLNTRQSIYQRLLPGHRGLTHKTSQATNLGGKDPAPSQPQTPAPRDSSGSGQASTSAPPPRTGPMPRRVSYATAPTLPGFSPVLESVDHAVKNTAGLLPIQPLQLSDSTVMTTDDFTRAVAVATVSALRHQQTHAQTSARLRASGAESEAGGHGGHDAPNWSRTTSASVLLACTALYAMIAEILVDVVDAILEGSGIDEKFLGITIFALVPNTTEFMNAISFALNGNIALSMEIGSAYALQVCLLQIPAMVGFSAWYAPEKMGQVAYTFTLIFPRWDVIVIILSMFLMTYTYIEAKSNYHRGSILTLSYLVLVAGYYYAPHTEDLVDQVHLKSSLEQFSLTGYQYVYGALRSLGRWW